MPVDFSMTNHRVSQCQAVGTGHFVWTEQCLGGMQGSVQGGGWSWDGGGGGGGLHDESPLHSDLWSRWRGFSWMLVRGAEEQRPSTPSFAKANVELNKPLLFSPSFSVCPSAPCVSLSPSVNSLWTSFTGSLCFRLAWEAAVLEWLSELHRVWLKVRCLWGFRSGSLLILTTFTVSVCLLWLASCQLQGSFLLPHNMVTTLWKSDLGHWDRRGQTKTYQNVFCAMRTASLSLVKFWMVRITRVGYMGKNIS